MATPQAKFQIKATDKTAAGFKKVKQGLGDVAGKFRGLGLAAGVAVVAIGALIAKNNQLIDRLAKTSDALGITIGSLENLRRAADLTGSSAAVLDKSLQNLAKNVTEASQGTGEAADSFKALGLEAAVIARLPLDEQFARIADAMETVKNQAERIEISRAIFGRGGFELINTLALGSAGLESMAARTAELGLALSRVDAATIEAANDAVADLGRSARGLANTLSIATAPALAITSEMLTELVISTFELAPGAQIVEAAFIRIARTMQGVINLAQAGFQAFRQLVFRSLELIVRGVDVATEALRKGLDMIPFVETQKSGLGDFADFLKALGDEAAAARALEFEEFLTEGSVLETELRARFDQFMADQEARAAALEERLRAIREGVEGGGAGEVISEKLDAEFLIFEEHGIRMAELEADTQRRIFDIMQVGLTAREKFEALSTTQRIKKVAGILQKGTAIAASTNKTMFRINQAAALANAVVNTAVSVTNALAIPPPPVGIALAAIMAAAGLAEINAIKSAQFGGGGAVPTFNAAPATGIPTGGGVGGLALAAPQEIAPVTQVNITIEGTPTSQQVIDLIEEINEAIGDGVELIATPA